MSDLPDDVRRWPRDPFKLLGVPPNTPPRELKRAYTRLIRAFKPEHAPEEFRRIREAYDSIRQFSEFYGAFQQDEPPASAGPPTDVDATLQRREPSGEPEPRPTPRRPSLEEQLDDCWRWATSGDEPKAYRALEQLHAQVPHDARVCSRLYWLLTVVPELDRAKSPCDWLAAGLRHSGLAGPLRELYRRELNANPSEATSDRCAALLETAAALGALADFVELRWTALVGQQKAVERMRDDLGQLRPRFLSHDDEVWVRVVLAAVDRLAFMNTPEAADLLARCHHDLQGLSHLHFRLSADFDRYDLLQELVAKQRILAKDRSWPLPEFVEVIGVAWTSSVEELKPRLMSFLAAIAERPALALRRFDAVRDLASPMLYQFRRLLSSLDQAIEPACDERTPADISELVLAFARDTPGSKYADWRTPLLDFCLREMVMPEQVAAALAGNREFVLGAETLLSDMASGDLPLACVCHSCRLVWS